MDPTDNKNPPAEVDLSGLDAAIGSADDQTRPPEPPVETPPPDAGQPEKTETPAAPPSVDAKDLTADVLDGTPAPDPKAGEQPAPKAGETPAAKPAELVDPATLIPGTPEHAAAVEAKRVHDEAEAKKAAENTPEAIAERERAAAVDKEADALGLKNKARDRFHELNREVAAAKPFTTELEKAGIKDVDTLRATIEGAYAAVDMVGMVQETGADPQQYSFALEYLTLNNRADAGDVDAQRKCLEWIRDEYVRHAKALGVEVPGLVDPLEAFPDLKDDLANERITRERALELAQQRTVTATANARRQAAATRTTEATELEQAIETGKAELTAFGRELASGPEAELYKALKPQLVAALNDVVTKYPASQWRLAASFAWDAVKIKAARPAPTPTPTPTPNAGGNVGPVRPAGPQPVLEPGEFDDPMKALEAGIDAADRGA